MSLHEKLQSEATARAADLAARFPQSRCIACAAPAGNSVTLRPTEFHWRKQVGRSEHHHVRVTHVSTHPLCPACLAQLRHRRRRFWPLRYAGGVTLAAACCALIAPPILLAFMHLDSGERTQVLITAAAGLLLLPAALVMLRSARRFSVPHTLLDLTGRGWDCTAVKG
jgi:hypothetical protein